MSFPPITFGSLVQATLKPAVFGLIAGLSAELAVKKTTEYAADFFMERMNQETTKDSTIKPEQKKVIEIIAENSGREIRNLIFITSGVATVLAATVSSVFVYDCLVGNIRR